MDGAQRSRRRATARSAAGGERRPGRTAQGAGGLRDRARRWGYLRDCASMAPDAHGARRGVRDSARRPWLRDVDSASRRLVANDGARLRASRGTIFVAVFFKKPSFGTSSVPARALFYPRNG
eukprot:6212044-Pleurochrysis_carterae.AAC.2